MNQDRGAAVTRSWTSLPSRRDVLRGLAGAGLGLGDLRLPDAAARKKRNKSKKPKPSAFGCLSVGAACKNADQCCSGICTRKKGKRTCRAHGTGTCNQAITGPCDPKNPTIAVCNSDICACVRTTAGSNFCATARGGADCVDCKKDADCLALGFPPGSACIPYAEGGCAGTCESGMMCAPPCGYVPPDPDAGSPLAVLIGTTPRRPRESGK